MDERTNNRLLKLAFGIMLLPPFVMLLLLSLDSFKDGDWHIGIAMLTIVPFTLATWFLSRRYVVPEADLLTGGEKRRAVFRNWFIEIVPLVLCFGFFGLNTEMTALDAIVAYLRVVAILFALSLIGFSVANWILDKWAAWRSGRR